MDNDGKDKAGLLVSNDDGTFFIPDAELSGYRLPDAVAESVDEAMDSEVEGFARRPTAAARPELKSFNFAFRGAFSAAQLPCQYSDCPI